MNDRNENSEQTDANKDQHPKSDGYGRTSWVIPKRDFNFQGHDWHQEGTTIICESCPQKHAHQIPVDRMLVRNEQGEFAIVPVPILV